MSKVMTEAALVRTVNDPEDLYKELLTLCLEEHLWPEEGLDWYTIIENSPQLEEEALGAIIRALDEGYLKMYTSDGYTVKEV